MTNDHSPEDLARVGLTLDRLGAESTLETASIAHGRTFPEDLDFQEQAGRGFQDLDFDPLRDDVPESLGIHLQVARRDRRIVRLELPPGEPFEARPSRAEPRAVIHRDPELGVLFLDLRSGPIRVLSSGGAGLYLAYPRVVVVMAVPLDVRPLRSVDCPVATWCEAWHDSWLVEQVRARVALDDPWETVAAAGMAARLAEPPTAGAQSTLDKLIAGQAWAPAAQPRDWARALDGDALDTIERLALAAVDHAYGLLEELRSAPQPEETGWLEDLRELLHGRDDLEGVHLLLVEGRSGATLGKTLEGLDDAGERFLRTLPTRLRLADIRLQRAYDRDPAWWDSLAGE